MNRHKIIHSVCWAAVILFACLYLLQAASNGKEIYLREGCGNCHNFKGHGGAMAPDLTSVTERRSRIWIMMQIRNPKSHYPDARMPDFSHLSIIELFALSQYLRG